MRERSSPPVADRLRDAFKERLAEFLDGVEAAPVEKRPPGAGVRPAAGGKSGHPQRVRLGEGLRGSGGGSPHAQDVRPPATSRGAPAPELPPQAAGRQRLGGGDAAQSIDVDALRDELGLGAGREPEPEVAEGVSQDPMEKEIALREFVRRVVPTFLHQQILTVMFRQGLTSVDPGGLARAIGVKVRDVTRVLDDWNALGILDQEGGDAYRVAPPGAELALIREFLSLWSRPDWHNRLLGWITQAAAR